MPPANRALIAAHLGGESALLATVFLLVICLGLSRVPPGIAPTSDVLARGMFALALGLFGLHLATMSTIWIAVSLLCALWPSQHVEPTRTAGPDIPKSRRSISPGILDVEAIVLLPVGVLGILGMIALSPPIWVVLAAGLVIALAAGAGALWEIRPQAPLQRTIPRNKATR
jgi:hypothetical protein